MTSLEIDQRFMRVALGLARSGLGQVWPNPSVGCVLVKDGQIIAEGRTQVGGRPHAEVVALQGAGDAAKGATAYVTLEPCTHHGKSPPCCDALIAAGVSRVVYAVDDVDPRVAGKAATILERAGIKVTSGVLNAEARAQNAGFFKMVQEGLPLVTLKLAMSLDGRIATATGESKWITGPDARRHVHRNRAEHDAVMVGGGTARHDDPSLTARDVGAVSQPARVVVSAQLDLPLSGKLAATAKDIPLFIVHAVSAPKEITRAWEGVGARLLPVSCGRDLRLSPREVLSALAEQGLTRVYCEGGGQLAASLLEAGLVDELHVYTAGITIGTDGLAGVGLMNLAKLADTPSFELVTARPLGKDLFQHWRKS
ncbi:bifunctional diaminohydroxyphosphoribosylaminopyrimidine deaminase/5-amino-6-(5-phosphoribosylamino)uracil reductase RibD [Halocynthiibacter sp. C4]|uniref:bifunctional diaminohydroxyphosphoribosylaminopyrimidine deaminase/5-amino-6-(5-phosphoribosylamino)uracil reductase RibD n=1 Tax=Halocynthiibacter sp. C4 TaxID=2992758 RepID=UPI00237A90C2|nr:bifunctional diaminohydroxyphosphoribosylaminopyrimidine deaminase/5-amino-6-(5-phosphoribosylamino)uracil reductase RibD [Halocynthiibacter sp. C4]MDE0589033.1 bifunctional diaminohydroxyphosphoribosylaminopyrimidine deaminase/5-amino-6-(5-phosphoribosylamino)uracil reductase RibD [Halocynthiibacter sp. C4]